MKTAVITGGTRGIGAAMVRSFLEAGWNVAYSGTSETTIEKSMQSLEGHFEKGSYAAFRCDVSVEADLISLWDSAVSTFGGVDIWLTNWKVIRRFLFAPFSRRDIVSRYL